MSFRATITSLCLLASIAGSSFAQNSTTIYVMPSDGGSARKIAEAPGFNRVGHPRWSHDGKRLAFHAWDGPPRLRKVFVVNADGTGLREVGSEGQFPDWSPDDKQLAFQTRDDAGRIGTFVQNLDGSGRTFLVTALSPRWSPDGGQLVFADRRVLIVRDLVDDSDRSVLDNDWEEIQPGFDWSPDGRWIALVAKRGENDRLGLWILDVKNPAPRLRLSGNLMHQVAWSPDGKQVAITLDSLIHTVNVNDAQPARPIPGQIGNSRDPAWSPDGKSIAFSSNRDVKEP